MKPIKKLYHKERAHLDKLNPEGRKLIKAVIIYNIIAPLFNLFLTAYLFRQTEDLGLVVLFNLFLFSAIPVGFYINGLLVKRFAPHILYISGLTGKALIFITLIFLPTLSLTSILLFALGYGLALGLYWANRNFLTLQATTSENRIYFSGLESVSKSTMDVFTPFVIGLLFTFGTAAALITPKEGYQLLAILMAFAIIIVSYSLYNLKSKPMQVDFVIRNKTKQWTLFRLCNTVLGFLSITNMVIPALMILTLVGDEGALGIIQAFSALFSSIALYSLSKKINAKHRLKLLAVSTILNITGAGIFITLYSATGVFFFIASLAVALPLWWAYMTSMSYDLIDKEYPSLEKRYAAVCDREINFGIGRVISLSLFLLLIQYFSNDIALHYMPITFIFFQIFLFVIAWTIERTGRSLSVKPATIQ